MIFVVALARPDRPAQRRRLRALRPRSRDWRSRWCCCSSASIWLFPLITALVAGDIIAAEDQNGTLKTILTRSLDRGRIFAAKALAALTYALAALVLMGLTAVIGRRR